MPEQLRLQFDQPNEQSSKFHKLKDQVSQLQIKMDMLTESTEFAQSVMRKTRNEVMFELQKECRHQQKPSNWNDALTFYCPFCGKPL